MNPYLFTIAFLLLMSFLTSSEVARFAHAQLEHTCYLCAQECEAVAEEIKVVSAVSDFRQEEAGDTPPKEKTTKREGSNSLKHARSLRIDAERPPNNSRLNVYTLLHAEPSKEFPKEISLYEILARVMRTLYQEEPFFSEVSQAEYRILDTLIEKKEETLLFETPDELSTLSFDNEKLQQIFYQMLKGTKKSPSLLNYITFDKLEYKKGKQNKKINFLFSDPLIIRSIFPQKTAEKLIAARDTIWERIAFQEEHRSEIAADEAEKRSTLSKELKEALEMILTQDGYNPKKYKRALFDCTLGEGGTVLFYEETPGGHLLRKPYKPKKS